MTALLIQNLRIEDCEATLERGYFDWGRGWPDDSPEPDWDRATREQRRAIALRGYRLYDGWPSQPGNNIGATEVYVSLGVNSGVLLYDVVRFLVRAEQAEPLLAGIPDDARLEDATDGELTAAAALIELCTNADRIGLAKATKVLYRKRPAFIPVIDSVVHNFLWTNFPHLLGEGSPTVDLLHVYREVLLARREPLVRIQGHIAAMGLTLSTARILSYLVWHHWQAKAGTLRQVWRTASLASARQMAREMWEHQ